MHKKDNSTDTISSIQKRKFIEVISADSMLKKLTSPSIKTIVHLKNKELGHRVTRSDGQSFPTELFEVDCNRGSTQQHTRRESGFKPIKTPNMIPLSEKTNDRPSTQCGSETPIKKLLFESSCK